MCYVGTEKGVKAFGCSVPIRNGGEWASVLPRQLPKHQVLVVVLILINQY